MLTNRVAKAIIVATSISVLSLQAALADVLLDQSPEASNAPASGDSVYAHSELGYFADRAQFFWPTVLTGIDMYSFENESEAPGDPRTIRIWQGNKGFPTTLIVDLNEPIALIDYDGVGVVPEFNRKHVDLTIPVVLDAFQDYWVAMFGEGALSNGALGLSSNPPDDGRMAVFTSFGDGGDVMLGDLAFRLHGHTVDSDSDGFADDVDNCQWAVNLGQRDTDADGIGNQCDADLTNDCIINFLDLEQLKQRFLTSDATADFDGNGVVDFGDLLIMRNSFFQLPGPSAIANTCDSAPSANLVSMPGPVSGSVPVFATLDDEYGVTLALLRVDGVISSRLSAPPWQFDWDTHQVLDGERVLTVDAVDTAGQVTTSNPVVAVVENGNQLLFDYSPATTSATGIGGYSNYADGTNFGERVVFPTDVTLTQIDIFSKVGAGRVGNPVTIRVWADNAAEPGQLLYELLESVSEIDIDGVGLAPEVSRKEARLSEPLHLPAGAYWMGMSLTNETYPLALCQMALSTNSPDDGHMARFFGTDFMEFTNIGDMAIRVIGSPVP